ncbi:MAG TPA: hypothetical protein VHY20_05115 [Pirellulales bacterium]|nr:hypothetical protein [Pirellulales bacterium]
MAREEHDREDLLGEAVALVERVELELAGPGHVIAGFRSDGSASLYFDGDPAWHFNSAGQLRRAFVDGLLYKAERARLVRLRRERGQGAVNLWRHDCSAEETAALVARLTDDLATLERALAAGDYRLIGQVPADAPLVERVSDWLARLPGAIELAATPRAG